MFDIMKHLENCSKCQITNCKETLKRFKITLKFLKIQKKNAQMSIRKRSLSNNQNCLLKHMHTYVEISSSKLAAQITATYSIEFISYRTY